MESIHKLVLHPCSAAYAPPSWSTIKAALREIGFVGDKFGASQESNYYVGDNFLQLVTFMGCSPAIDVSPQSENTAGACYVQFKLMTDIQFRYTHQYEVRAQCPRCGGHVASWREYIDSWRNDSNMTQFVCEKCENSGSIFSLGWRKRAGFACLFIDIYNIYPQEGIPTEQLLTVLEETTQQKWTYFFSND